MKCTSGKEHERIEVEGKELACLVCGNGMFRRRKALLNTRFLTLFDLDWANRNAECAVCTKCGYVHWFLKIKR